MLAGDDWWRSGRRPDDEDASDDEDWSDNENELGTTCRRCGAELFDDDVATCPKCGFSPSREEPGGEPRKPLWILVTAIILFALFAWLALP